MVVTLSLCFMDNDFTDEIFHGGFFFREGPSLGSLDFKRTPGSINIKRTALHKLPTAARDAKYAQLHPFILLTYIISIIK